MDDNGVRSSIQRLVLGPVTKSLSFWVEVMFMVLAAVVLTSVWRDASRFPALSNSIQTSLVLILGVLVFASYIYFSGLVKLRKQARTETDEGKRKLLCESADMAFRMFSFGLGGMVLGLGLCSTLLIRVATFR